MVEYSDKSADIMFEVFCEEHLTERMNEELKSDPNMKNLLKTFYKGGITDWIMNLISKELENVDIDINIGKEDEDEMKKLNIEGLTFTTDI